MLRVRTLTALRRWGRTLVPSARQRLFCRFIYLLHDVCLDPCKDFPIPPLALRGFTDSRIHS